MIRTQTKVCLAKGLCTPKEPNVAELRATSSASGQLHLEHTLPSVGSVRELAWAAAAGIMSAGLRRGEWGQERDTVMGCG